MLYTRLEEKVEPLLPNSYRAQWPWGGSMHLRCSVFHGLICLPLSFAAVQQTNSHHARLRVMRSKHFFPLICSSLLITQWGWGG